MESLVLVDLGKGSTALIEYLDLQVGKKGRRFVNGGTLATASLPAAVAAVGAAGSFNAGNVFVSAAAPTTLMSAGTNAVYSAVVSGGQIVSQAPFMAVPAAALTPAVAPLLLLAAVSALPVAIGFHRIERDLDALKEVTEELLKRDKAEDHARFRSACERLEDLRVEYGEGLRFTDEMIVRLALVEQEVNILRHKYSALAKGRNRVEKLFTAKLSAEERRMLVLACIADIQVDHLRLRLALQENLADVGRSKSRLTRKVDEYAGELHELAESDPGVDYRQRLEGSVATMRRWTKLLPWSPTLKAERRLEELEELERNSAAITDTLARPGMTARHPSIVFWKEGGGDGHPGGIQAFYTSDLSVEIKAEPSGTPLGWSTADTPA